MGGCPATGFAKSAGLGSGVSGALLCGRTAGHWPLVASSSMAQGPGSGRELGYPVADLFGRSGILAEVAMAYSRGGGPGSVPEPQTLVGSDDGSLRCGLSWLLCARFGYNPQRSVCVPVGFSGPRVVVQNGVSDNSTLAHLWNLRSVLFNAFGLCNRGSFFLSHAHGIAAFSKPGGSFSSPSHGVLSKPKLVPRRTTQHRAQSPIHATSKPPQCVLIARR